MSDRRSRMSFNRIETNLVRVDLDATDEAYEDPYAPTSPGYAERHKVTRYEILPGLFREDIGG